MFRGRKACRVEKNKSSTQDVQNIDLHDLDILSLPKKTARMDRTTTLTLTKIKIRNARKAGEREEKMAVTKKVTEPTKHQIRCERGHQQNQKQTYTPVLTTVLVPCYCLVTL